RLSWVPRVPARQPEQVAALSASNGQKDHAMTTETSTGALPGPRVVYPPSYSSLVRIDVAALSHRGHVRPDNEDHFFVTRLGRTLETLTTSLPQGAVPSLAEEVNYVMMVADGMGGHAGGEVASRMAISALVSIALELPDWILTLNEEYAGK